MKEAESTILYLCDGRKDCSKKYCYKVIGDCKGACKHTTDINHAKNFHKFSQEGDKIHALEEDDVILKQILEHLMEIKEELQAIRNNGRSQRRRWYR